MYTLQFEVVSQLFFSNRYLSMPNHFEPLCIKRTPEWRSDNTSSQVDLPLSALSCLNSLPLGFIPVPMHPAPGCDVYWSREVIKYCIENRTVCDRSVLKSTSPISSCKDYKCNAPQRCSPTAVTLMQVRFFKLSPEPHPFPKNAQGIGNRIQLRIATKINIILYRSPNHCIVPINSWFILAFCFLLCCFTYMNLLFFFAMN